MLDSDASLGPGVSHGIRMQKTAFVPLRRTCKAIPLGQNGSEANLADGGSRIGTSDPAAARAGVSMTFTGDVVLPRDFPVFCGSWRPSDGGENGG